MKIFRVTAVAATVLLAGCASNSSAVSSKAENTLSCKPVTEQEVAGLFDRWNSALKTGRVDQVVQQYGDASVLLPTLSAQVRVTRAEKEDYFEHFLSKQPEGTIDWRWIDLACNSAVDTGLYTFFLKKSGERVKARYTFTYKWNGQDWLISSHHSSILPSDQ